MRPNKIILATLIAITFFTACRVVPVSSDTNTSSGSQPVVVVSPSEGTPQDTFTLEAYNLPANEHVYFAVFTYTSSAQILVRMFDVTIPAAYDDGGPGDYSGITDSSGRFMAELKADLNDPEAELMLTTGRDGFYVRVSLVDVCSPSCDSNAFYLVSSGVNSGAYQDAGSREPAAQEQNPDACSDGSTNASIVFDRHPMSAGEPFLIWGQLGSEVQKGQPITIEIRKGWPKGERVHSVDTALGQDCEYETWVTLDDSVASGVYYAVIPLEGGERDHWNAEFELEAAEEEAADCRPARAEPGMVVRPTSGLPGEGISVTVDAWCDYRNGYLTVYIIGPDGNYLDPSANLLLDQNGWGEISLTLGAHLPPGNYRVVISANGNQLDEATYVLEGEPSSYPLCGSDEYFRAGVNFKDILEWYTEDLNDFWGYYFGQYFTNIFGEDEFGSAGIVFNSLPTDCDDGHGQSAQYLGNFNVATGEMVISEIRIDGPALMPKYFEYGEAVGIVVIAHEFGHAVQIQAGLASPIKGVGKEGELQADCLAGVYIADGRERGAISDSVFEQIVDFHSLSGDIEGTTIPHGTSDERVDALFLGMNEGVAGCIQGYVP